MFAFLLKSFSVEKCIDKAFKNKVCSQYQDWMMNCPFTYKNVGEKASGE